MIPEGTRQYWATVLVDTVYDHLYKADILIRTLIVNGGVPPNRIIIQHVPGLPAASIETFSALGCKTRQIEPFLDKRYCNKLQQLSDIDQFGVSKSDGVVLFDVDIAIAAPLAIPDPNRIAGKIVDAPNPPLSVLTKIFEAAKVPFPEIIQCDWNIGETFATNLNGGVLYIPSELIPRLERAWKEFALFLFKNSQLFDDDSHKKYIDQISFALAIGATNAPYSHLASNSNFPTHFNYFPRTYDSQRPIEALHYHWNLDDFGFIKPLLGTAALDAAARIANRFAATCSNISFYKRFKSGQANRLDYGDEADLKHPVMQKIIEFVENTAPRPRLVFHAGTPKTGTSAMQYFLEENRTELARDGIWYPDTNSHTPPKHQFLVEQLITGDLEGFGLAILSALRTMPRNATVVLFSTEGLFNHWWDFSAKGRLMFRFLASLFRLEFVVCFRDPAEFAVSLYKQNIYNPSIHPCYGKDISFEQMMENEWFKKHLDYVSFLMEVKRIGNVNIKIFKYSKSIVYDILEYIGVSNIKYDYEFRNKSLHLQGLEMVRIINRYIICQSTRNEILSKIVEIERLLGERLESYCPSSETIDNITSLTDKNKSVMQGYEQGLEFLD
jgi:hypothetical protein